MNKDMMSQALEQELVNLTDQDMALNASPATLYQRLMVQVDKRVFSALLVKHRGNITACARELGINRGTFRTKAIAAGVMPRQLRRLNLI
jgi:DNA-binding protein Fis